MAAKKAAPKASKPKKASRPAAARKPVARKTPERAKTTSHARKSAAPASKKPVPTRSEPVAAAETPKRQVPPKSAEKPVVPPAPAPVTRSTLPALETEESDAGEASSLLAGPRNVQPYIAKRGEQYMNKEQLEHFRSILLSWKHDLMQEVDRTVSHMKDEAANFPDPNDRATQEEEFSLELRTRDRERKLIRKIDEALKRIEDGSYGYCLETGEEIGIKRLEARPVATLSLEAQERRERREKQYGDRDDRYR
jgi:DnaK suppressor protein